MTAGRAPALANYQLRLAGFEGPLDVLLRMIEQRQMEVSELSLVAVTEGFLQYIDELQDASPQLLAEFAGIASRLLVLKSRALLPKPETDEPDQEVDDLTAQLREYQQTRRLAARLREHEDAGRRSFQRAVTDTQRTVSIRLELPTVDALYRSFAVALDRQPSQQEIAPIRRIVSVAEMAQRFVRTLVRSRQTQRFADLVHIGDRQETVAGFVALLILWNREALHVHQERLFGDISVTGKPSLPAALDSDE